MGKALVPPRKKRWSCCPEISLDLLSSTITKTLWRAPDGLYESSETALKWHRRCAGPAALSVLISQKALYPVFYASDDRTGVRLGLSSGPSTRSVNLLSKKRTDSQKGYRFKGLRCHREIITTRSSSNGVIAARTSAQFSPPLAQPGFGSKTR